MYDLACCNLLCKSQTGATYVANEKFLLQFQERDVLKGSKDRANMIHDVLVQNSTSFILLFSMCGCNLERSKQLRETFKIHIMYEATIYISGNVFQTTFPLSKPTVNVFI
jgi:hypothetical protein